MSANYDDSPYAFERVGFTLHCEHGWGDAISEGAVPKCTHCGDTFEYHPDEPKPCIERIAKALIAIRLGHEEQP